LEIFTNTNGDFTVTFYPAIREYGSYQAASRHPGISITLPQIEWEIVGLTMISLIF